MWWKVECIRNMYDPWSKPKMAAYRGKQYRAYQYEDGHWDIQSTETNHTIPMDEESFFKVFRVIEVKQGKVVMISRDDLVTRKEKEIRRIAQQKARNDARSKRKSKRDKRTKSQSSFQLRVVDVLFITTYLTNFFYAVIFDQIHWRANSFIVSSIGVSTLLPLLTIAAVAIVYKYITHWLSKYYAIFNVIEIMVSVVTTIYMLTAKSPVSYFVADMVVFFLLLHKIFCGIPRAEGISYKHVNARETYATVHNIAATVSIIMAALLATMIFKFTETSFILLVVIGTATNVADNALCALACISNYTIDIGQSSNNKE